MGFEAQAPYPYPNQIWSKLKKKKKKKERKKKKCLDFGLYVIWHFYILGKKLPNMAIRLDCFIGYFIVPPPAHFGIILKSKKYTRVKLWRGELTLHSKV